MKGQHSHTTPRFQGPETPDTTHIKNETVSHETGDVNVRAIVRFCIGLAVGIALSMLLMLGVFKLFQAHEDRVEPRAHHVAKNSTDRLPPEPRLQLAPGHAIHPLEELIELQDSMHSVEHSYAWVDQKAGVVRIPIERAKELLLERNAFPSRTQDSASAKTSSEGIVIPEFSSAGRMLIRRDQRLPAPEEVQQ